MNEELLKIIYDNGPFKEHGKSFEDFSTDMLNDDIRRVVYDNGPFKEHGKSFENFSYDLGVSPQEPTVIPKSTISDATTGWESTFIPNINDDKVFNTELQRRQKVTDDAHKGGEGSGWFERRGHGLINGVLGTVRSIEGLAILAGDKLGFDMDSTIDDFKAKSRQLELYDAEIPSNLKQSTFAEYTDFENTEVQVDDKGNFKAAFDDKGFPKKVEKGFVERFNDSKKGLLADRRAKWQSLAQSGEQTLIDVAIMLLGSKGVGALARNATEGLTKAAAEKVMKNTARATVGSIAFTQSFDDNYAEALKEFKDPDQALNVAFEKSAATAFITTLFPMAAETGGAFTNGGLKSTFNTLMRDGTKTFGQKTLEISKSILGEIIEENTDEAASNLIDIANGLDKEIMTQESFYTTSVLSGLIGAPGAIMKSTHRVKDNIIVDGILEAATDKDAYKMFTEIINESDQSEELKASKIEIVDTIKNNFEVFTDLPKENKKDLAINLWNKQKINKQLALEGLDDKAKERLEKELKEIDKNIEETLLIKDTEASGTIATANIEASKGEEGETSPNLKEIEQVKVDEDIHASLFGNFEETPIKEEVDKKSGEDTKVISDQEYSTFINNGTVSDEVLSKVADNIIQGNVTDKDIAIQQTFGKQIEEILKSKKSGEDTNSPTDTNETPQTETVVDESIFEASKVPQEEVDNFTPEEKVKHKVALKREEHRNLETELSAIALEIDDKINTEYGETLNSDSGDNQNTFTKPFDEEAPNSNGGTTANKKNASTVAKAVLDGRITKKEKAVFGEDFIKQAKEKAKRWRKLNGELNPSNVKNDTKQAKVESEATVAQKALEVDHPGITELGHIIKKQVDKVTKSLSKLGVKTIVYKTPKEYASAVKAIKKNASKSDLTSNGMYLDGVIHVNPMPSNPRTNTVFHEAAHAVFDKLISNNDSDAKLIHQTISEVLKKGSKVEKSMGKQIDQFISQYEGKDQSQEFFAELVALLADKKRNISARTTKKLKTALNAILKTLLGIDSFFNETDTILDIIHLINDISTSLEKGKDVTKLRIFKSEDIVSRVGSDPSLEKPIAKFQKGGNRDTVLTRVKDLVDKMKDAYPLPSALYSKFKVDFDAQGVTLRDIERVYRGLDPNRTAESYVKEAEAKITKLHDGLKEFGWSKKRIKATITAYESMARTWGKREGRDATEFWSDMIKDFKFVQLKDKLNKQNKLIAEKLPYSKAIKYNSGKVVTPLQKDIDKAMLGMEQGDGGLTMDLDDGSVLIFITSDASVTTPLHELAHAYEHFMSNEDKQTILEWVGRSTWSTEVSEEFAKGFERFIASPDNNVRDSKLAKAFKNFRKWVGDVFVGTMGNPISDKMKDVYTRMFDSEIEFIENPSQKYNDILNEYLDTDAAVQMTQETLEKFAKESGHPSVTSYMKTTAGQTMARVLNENLDTPSKASALVDRALHSIAESRNKGLAADTGLTIEEYQGVYMALTKLEANATALKESLEAAKVDITNNQPYQDLIREINAYHDVLNTTGSHTGLFLSTFRNYINSQRFTAEKAEEAISELKNDIDGKVREKIRTKFKELNDIQAKLTDEVSKQEKITEADELAEANKQMKTIRKHNTFAAAMQAVKNYTPQRIKDNYKTIQKFLSAKFDSKTNIKEALLSNIAKILNEDTKGKINTIEDLTETLNNEMIQTLGPEVRTLSVGEVKDLVLEHTIKDYGYTIGKLQTSKSMLKKEVGLIQNISNLLLDRLPSGKGRTIKRATTDEVDKLQETIGEMIKILTTQEGQIDDYSVTHIVTMLGELGKTYEGLAFNGATPKITEETVKDMLKMLDIIETRRYVATYGSVLELKKDGKENFIDDLLGIITPEESSKFIKSLGFDGEGPFLNQVKDLHKAKKLTNKIAEIDSDLAAIERVQSSKPTHEERIKLLDDKLEKYNINRKPITKVESKELSDLKYEYKEKRRALTQYLYQVDESTRSRRLRKLAATPKVLMLALDYSPVSYQGAILGAMHPSVAFEAFGKMVRASFSNAYFEKVAAEMEARPKFQLFKRSGLDISGKSELNLDEEMQWSTILDHIKFLRIGDATKGIQNFSKRSYNTYIDLLRYESMDAIASDTTDLKSLQQMAEHINTLSGAARQFGSESFSKRVNTGISFAQGPLIAPRLYASTFKSMIGMAVALGNTVTANKLTKKADAKLTKSELETKRAIQRNHARAFVGQAAVMGIALGLNAFAQWADPDDDDDNDILKPMSSDFGRLKFGQTRFTVSPFVSYTDAFIKFTYKLALDAGIAPRLNNVSPDFVDAAPWDVFYREFLKYRWNPALGTYTRTVTNKDFLGRQIGEGFRKQATERYLPSILPIPLAGLTKNIIGEPRKGIGVTVGELTLDMLGYSSFTKELHSSNTVKGIYKKAKFTLRVTAPKTWDKNDYRRVKLREQVRQSLAEEVIARKEAGKVSTKGWLKGRKDFFTQKYIRELNK